MNKLLILILFSFSNCSLIFQLLPNQPRCYVDELFENGSMTIKYKIFTRSRADVSHLLPKMQIYVTSEETKKQIFSEVPNLAKTKTSFKVKEEGQYRICAIYKSRDLGIKEVLYMYMKFGSDNMDDLDLKDALQSSDISSIDAKTKQIMDLSKPIIDRQKSELDAENMNAELTINNTKWYKYLTFAQIGVIFLIGIIQLNNFRRFLKSQNII